MFKFTFSVGGANPFATPPEPPAPAPAPIRRLPAPPRRAPPPPAAEDAPAAAAAAAAAPRKRGWAPTSSAASAATSQPTVTSGYIDTPAKYLTAAQQSQAQAHDADAHADAELPPAKRRKTLADAIISTAFSAALISTAVGIGAYRMWRDRGKTADEPRADPAEPPPPYRKDEWVDVPQNAAAVRAPRHSKKPRTTARRVPRQRRAPIVTSPVRSPTCPASPPKAAALQAEQADDQLDDQMDWMGDRIRHLIEEGQKALGKEVVVMSGEQSNEEEGAVDDGMEGWEEESAGPSSAPAPRARRQPPKSLAINTSASPPISPGFPPSYGSAPTSPRNRRSQAAGGHHSRAPSGWGSPHFDPSKLRGRRFPGSEDVRVIYEPGAIAADYQGAGNARLEDEDSRRLTEGMDAVRKAYKIH